MIQGVKEIIQVVAAGYTSIVKSVNLQFVFGSNECSQVGIEDKSDILVPVEVQELWSNGVIVPGGEHNILVDERGCLYFFGSLKTTIVSSGKQKGMYLNLDTEQMKRACA